MSRLYNFTYEEYCKFIMNEIGISDADLYDEDQQPSIDHWNKVVRNALATYFL